MCSDEEVEIEEPRDEASCFGARLGGTRPRRESSGYSSIIGTFDEDRRHSSCADIIQDLFLRRRSSTKRPSSRSSNVGDDNADRRMPATELLGRFPSGTFEMPDIQEAKQTVADDKDKELLRKLERLGQSASANEEEDDDAQAKVRV